MARKHQKLIKIPFRRDITLIRNKSIYNDKKLWKLTLQNNFRGMANTLACVQQTPLPLEILRGGEGKAAHRLPITLHMRIAKECSWTLPGAFSSLQSHSTLFLTEITWPKETTGCGDENGLDIAR